MCVCVRACVRACVCVCVCVRACVCLLDIGGRCDIFNVGVGVTVSVGVGVVLAVNVKAVEGRNTSTPNRSQKQCFMMFHFVLLHFNCILLSLLC